MAHCGRVAEDSSAIYGQPLQKCCFSNLPRAGHHNDREIFASPENDILKVTANIHSQIHVRSI